MEREIDPDFLAAEDLMQEVRDTEFRDNISQLPPEIQERYAVVAQARQMLTDAGIPALIFCFPREESIFQTNNWRQTLYVVENDKVFADKLDIAWVQVSLSFLNFLSARFPSLKADLPPLGLLTKWFEFCLNSVDDGK